VVFLLTEFPLRQQKFVSFTFRCALIFVDTYAHTLFLEVNSIFNTQFSYQMSARPDHDRQASGRLKLNTQFPYLLDARPDQAD
jgi:hypothetical protein